MRQTEIRRTRHQSPVIQSLFGEAPTLRGPHGSRKVARSLQGPEFRELGAFLALAGQWIADYRNTASVMPSSPQLARAMVRPAVARNAKVFVEFGPGTGPMTQVILDELPKDGEVLSFEINPVFVEYLATHFPDPRLRVIPQGAETALESLREHGHTHADAVISSLPLSFFPQEMRERILSTAAESLRPGGVFTQFQYASGLDCSGKFPKPYDLRPLLGKYFPRVRRHLVWKNLPPAFVYTCSPA